MYRTRCAYTLPITSLRSKLTTTFKQFVNVPSSIAPGKHVVLINSFNSAQVWTTNTNPSWIRPVSLETKPFIVTATHNQNHRLLFSMQISKNRLLTSFYKNIEPKFLTILSICKNVFLSFSTYCDPSKLSA